MILEVTFIIGCILFVFYVGYFLLLLNIARKRKMPNNREEKKSLPFVSVVVATYNEEDTISKKLTNLMSQDYPSMEVIVIDSASNDRTVELVRKFVNDHNFRVRLFMQGQRKGKASALNIVCPKHCAGEIVVITDADAIWENNTLKKLVSSFDDSDVGAVTGKQILLNVNQKSTVKLEKAYRSVFDVLRIGETILDSTPIFNGPLMAFRSSLLEPIPEDTIADDSHLAVQIRKRGFRSVYNSDALYYEYVPPTIKSRFAQKVRRGQGLVQMFLRERGMFLNPKYGRYGMVVFPAEFFMHVVSPTMLAMFLVFLFWSLFMIFLSLTLYSMIIASLIFAVAVVAFVAFRISIIDVVLTFLDSQFILLIALIYQLTGKSQYKWKKISEVGKLSRAGPFSPSE